MVDFKDEKLFVHVKFNKTTNQPGKTLRLYRFDTAAGQMKYLNKIQPPNPELRFDGNYTIKGANFSRVVDYLKERSIFVNCKGRIQVRTVRHNPTIPVETFFAQGYFPWHTFGGPPAKYDKSSLDAVDLNGDKVPGSPLLDRDGEKKLEDRIKDLEKQVGNLTKENNDLKNKGGGGGGGGTTGGTTPTYSVIDFTPAQIASTAYGMSFDLKGLPFITRSEYVGSGQSARIEVFTRTNIRSNPIRFMYLVRYQEDGGNRRYTIATLHTRSPQYTVVPLQNVDTNMWSQTGALTYQSRPGSIWSQ